MKVLAKLNLPYSKYSRDTPRELAKDMKDWYKETSEDKFVYVNSPYDYSNKAKSLGLNNRIEKFDSFLNCMFVERMFNHALKGLLYDNKITEHDIKGFVITSAFRSPLLNKALNGSPTSLHCRGLAIDVFHENAGVLKIVTDLFIERMQKLTGWQCCDRLIPYEVISYTPNRIHLGFVYATY